jgi:hypothetical protein
MIKKRTNPLTSYVVWTVAESRREWYRFSFPNLAKEGKGKVSGEETKGAKDQACTVTMRILEIVGGIILLGGAAWATVRTYKGRGKSSYVILLFAIFLVAMGLYFLVDAFGALLRDFRIGSEWIR